VTHREHKASKKHAFLKKDGHDGTGACICELHSWGGLDFNRDCPGQSGGPALVGGNSAVANTTPSRGNAHNVLSPTQDIEIGNSFLVDYEQRHPWAFGAFAELVQNSDDAGSKELHITYAHADAQERLPEMLILADDGNGMTAERMKLCLQLGSSRPQRAEDNSISGQYGVGFKQGVLRLGHTALVISRSEEEASISFGVLSNQPHMPSAQRYGAPVCKYTCIYIYLRLRVQTATQVATNCNTRAS